MTSRRTFLKAVATALAAAALPELPFGSSVPVIDWTQWNHVEIAYDRGAVSIRVNGQDVTFYKEIVKKVAGWCRIDEEHQMVRFGAFNTSEYHPTNSWIGWQSEEALPDRLFVGFSVIEAPTKKAISDLFVADAVPANVYDDYLGGVPEYGGNGISLVRGPKSQSISVEVVLPV